MWCDHLCGASINNVILGINYPINIRCNVSFKVNLVTVNLFEGIKVGYNGSSEDLSNLILI